MGFHLEPFKPHEEAIDDYLDRYEELAELHNIPEDKKALKLSLSLRGVGYQIYSSLSATDKKNYDVVKSSLFRHFQVTGENYRRKFRNSRKESHETYVQFSNRLNMSLLKWLKLADLNTTFEDLRDAMILEQIKNTLPSNTRTFIEEMGAKSLDQVLTLAVTKTTANEKFLRLYVLCRK